MSQLAFQEFRQAESPPPSRTIGARFRTLCANFWLNYFFFYAEHLSILCQRVKWFHLSFALRYSHMLNNSTRLNALRIFGPDTPLDRQRQFTRDVVGNFFDFVYDVGRAPHMTPAQVLALVESIHGEDRYNAARASKKGAIVITAHMGSFEAGMAALLEHEHQPIHVVFKRDERNRFEQIRSSLRKRLGVHEAAIDDGWTIWIRLRDALIANQVVTLQGDRVMPGQKGQPVPFFHGHLLIPTGPIKLAIASGAPLIPIFSIRTPTGRLRINIEDPIWVDPSAELINGIHPALLQFASVLERQIRAHPEQWLILQPAFIEDTPGRNP